MKKHLLVLFALWFSVQLSAQQGEIIYTDFEPDLYKWFWMDSIQNVGPQTLPIDLDRDGVKEWEICKMGGYHHIVGLWASFSHTNETYNPRDYASPMFNKGDTILTYDHWGTNPDSYFELHTDFHGYIGVRCPREGGYQCGWIEVSLIGDGSTFYDGDRMYIHVYVHRMAYCTIPDYPLRVGQTSLNWDVDENETPAFASVHPNPIDGGQLTVLGNDLREAVVFNTLGQQVAKAQGEGGTMRVDLTGLPAGVYLVSVTDSEAAGASARW